MEIGLWVLRCGSGVGPEGLSPSSSNRTALPRQYNNFGKRLHSSNEFTSPYPKFAPGVFAGDLPAFGCGFAAL